MIGARVCNQNGHELTRESINTGVRVWRKVILRAQSEFEITASDWLC